MDLDRAIGQLIMVGFRGSSLDDTETRSDIAELKRARVGGVILFDRDLGTGGSRNIESHAQITKLTGDLRNELGGSILIAIDQEGGHVARLHPDRGFPISWSAAAFAEMPPEKQSEYARVQAAELSGIGINLNFAPCVDLSINNESIIIAKKKRSFGSEPRTVIQCARRIIDAHSALGVHCCIKHFPGHGSAAGDTHEGIVDITDTYQPQELEPFQTLINDSISSFAVMTGHLMHRDHDAGNPASLSREITTGWLRNEIGYGGIVITDSLDMGGALGEGTVVRAINAGADIALNGNNTHAGFQSGLAESMAREIREGADPERILESAARLKEWTR